MMMEQYRRTYVRIDLDAICSNVEHMKRNLPEQTGIMAVIKADGYGHGAVPIAHVLEPMEEVSGFATATAEEALLLRGGGVKKPILVLGHTFPYAYEELIRENIRLTVFRQDTLPALADAAKRAGKQAFLHLKVDTGMSRIGITSEEEGVSFVKEVQKEEVFYLEGIYTHFAKADETDKTSAEQQFLKFQDVTQGIQKECGCRIPIRHCANSAGIVELPQTSLDMVRAGIILYGLWPSEQINKNIVSLKPALSWYSSIVYCKWIRPGTKISYGGTFCAKKPMRIATIPIGYGDGYPRSLSNIGYVLIRGRRAPILGRICMDQFMVDVTDIPEAAEEDEVILLGGDKTQQITAETLGALSGRFNYELVCNITGRVPRVFYRQGEVVSVNNGCHSTQRL